MALASILLVSVIKYIQGLQRCEWFISSEEENKRTSSLDLLNSGVAKVDNGILGLLQGTLGLSLGLVGGSTGAVTERLAGGLVRVF